MISEKLINFVNKIVKTSSTTLNQAVFLSHLTSHHNAQRWRINLILYFFSEYKNIYFVLIFKTSETKEK